MYKRQSDARADAAATLAAKETELAELSSLADVARAEAERARAAESAKPPGDMVATAVVARSDARCTR